MSAGEIAGYLKDDGYRYLAIDGTECRTDYIAWFLSYGTPPEGEVIHLNGDKADDRLINLAVEVGES